MGLEAKPPALTFTSFLHQQPLFFYRFGTGIPILCRLNRLSHGGFMDIVWLALLGALFLLLIGLTVGCDRLIPRRK
jgi:hypothetical protein